MKKVVILMFSIALLGASCSKEEQGVFSRPPKAGDVFVAGAIDGKAVLWKNGVAHYLTDGKRNAEALSVFVYRNNVYAVGYENSGQIGGQIGGDQTVYYTVAKLWKNGVAQNLTDGTRYAEAYSVFVAGGDVYVAGFENSGQMAKLPSWDVYYYPSVAKLWKNGKSLELTDGTFNAKALSVYVDGKDVYAVGFEERDGSGLNRFVAKLWKNGNVINLSSSQGLGSHASSVFVSDGDVYVAGSEGRDAIIWVNESAQKLTENTYYYSHSNVNSFYLSGKDIYAVGNHHGRQSSSAQFWKNGVEQPLDANYLFYSVYVSIGGDIYIAGKLVLNAVLWINGEIQYLTAENVTSIAYSVFVVE